MPVFRIAELLNTCDTESSVLPCIQSTLASDRESLREGTIASAALQQ